jgi:hypothetical protein
MHAMNNRNSFSEKREGTRGGAAVACPSTQSPPPRTGTGRVSPTAPSDTLTREPCHEGRC